MCGGGGSRVFFSVCVCVCWRRGVVSAVCVFVGGEVRERGFACFVCVVCVCVCGVCVCVCVCVCVVCMCGGGGGPGRKQLNWSGVGEMTSERSVLLFYLSGCSNI